MNSKKSEERKAGAHGTIGEDYVFIHAEKSPEEIEMDNRQAESEYACGLMGERRDLDTTDWDAIESQNQKMFDSWRKLGPQSAQY